MEKIRVWMGEAHKEILVFALIIFSFLPLSFIGLDFVDFGYHFANQSRFYRVTEFLFNSSYYVLSDLLPGSLLKIFDLNSFFNFRLIGVILWAFIGGLFFNVLKSFLKKTCDISNDKLLAVCCFIGVVISARSLISGSLIMPDYYTVPIPLIIGGMFGLLKVLADRKPQYLFFSVFLILMPFFRLPLVLTSVTMFIIAIGWLFYIKSEAKWKLFGLFILALVLLFVFKMVIIESFSAKINSSHKVGLLFAEYISDLGKISKYFIALILIYTATMWCKNNIPNFYIKAGFNGAILSLSIFFGLKTGILQNELNLVLVLLSLIVLGSLAINTWSQGGKFIGLYAGVALLVTLCYPAGSNTGLVKMGYLAFLLIGPALFLFCEAHLQVHAIKVSLISFAIIVSYLHLYGGIYEDNKIEIVRRPTLISDSVLGFVITTPRNGFILNEYKAALKAANLTTSTQTIVAAHSPLLSEYIKDYDIRMSWPEIRSSEFLEQFVSSRCSSDQRQVLIFSKSNLANPGRPYADKDELSLLPKIWKKFCGWKVIFENSEFFVLMGEPPNPG